MKTTGTSKTHCKDHVPFNPSCTSLFPPMGAPPPAFPKYYRFQGLGRHCLSRASHKPRLPAYTSLLCPSRGHGQTTGKSGDYCCRCWHQLRHYAPKAAAANNDNNNSNDSTNNSKNVFQPGLGAGQGQGLGFCCCRGAPGGLLTLTEIWCQCGFTWSFDSTCRACRCWAALMRLCQKLPQGSSQGLLCLMHGSHDPSLQHDVVCQTAHLQHQVTRCGCPCSVLWRQFLGLQMAGVIRRRKLCIGLL